MKTSNTEEKYTAALIYEVLLLVDMFSMSLPSVFLDICCIGNLLPEIFFADRLPNDATLRHFFMLTFFAASRQGLVL